MAVCDVVSMIIGRLLTCMMYTYEREYSFAKVGGHDSVQRLSLAG